MEASTQLAAFPVSDDEVVGAADGGSAVGVGCRCARLRHERRLIDFPGSVPSSDSACRRLVSYTAFTNVIFLSFFISKNTKKVL